MATLEQIRTAVENLKDTIGPVLIRRQNAYFAAKGRYWQGIMTPSAPPDDLADATPDYSRRPSDQVERWADWFTGADALPATLKAQIRVDVQESPAGHGWSVSLRIQKNGTVYERTWGFHTSVDENWHAVVEGIDW